MDMFRPEIVMAIQSGGSPPTTVAKCMERAIHIEYRLAQLNEERARNFEARRNQRKEGAEGQTTDQEFQPRVQAQLQAQPIHKL